MDGAGLRVEDVFGDLPPIETERLLLRKMRLDDAEDLFEYGRDAEVARYVLWEPHEDIEDSKEFIRWARRQYDDGQIAPWGIEIIKTGKFVGTVGFHGWNLQHKRAEIGYSLARPYWGQGIMTEAARAVIDFGFRVMGLNRIEARCDPRNVGSAQVMEKCGMRFEAILREQELVKGRFDDMMMWAIVRQDDGRRTTDDGRWTVDDVYMSKEMLK